jgi:hypothetical protein
MTKPKFKVEETPAADLMPPDPRRAAMTGFCAFPSPGSHGYCHERFVVTGKKPCICPCHDEDPPPTSEGFGTVEAFVAQAESRVTDVLADQATKRIVRSGTPEYNDLKETTRIVKILNLDTGSFPLGPEVPETLQGYAAADVEMTYSLAKKLGAIGGVTVDLPLAFYDYYEKQGGAWGTVIKRMARNIRVRLNREEYDAMLEEAPKFVRTASRDKDPRRRAIAVSARATIAALEKAGRP